MPQKLRVAVLFGGKSGEHEVSIVSATNICNALDPSKYEVTLIGIDKSGRWLLPDQSLLLVNRDNPRLVNLSQARQTVSPVPFESKNALVAVEGGNSPMPGRFDVVIPVLHGTFGEDGTIQGLLELANIPYVGSGVVGSSTGMDKDVSRRLFAAAGIPVVPTTVLRRFEFERNPQKHITALIERFGLPFFVKPANMGSSVGVGKVKTQAEAEQKIRLAFEYDVKVLAEQAIDARELECAVLGNHEPRVSGIGEIIPTHEFYSYEAKYLDENGASVKIPAELAPKQVEQMQDIALRAFRALELSGLARVDFFVERTTGEIFLNEVNTFPGFTQISMYPKLWMASGMSYAGLLDELIRLAIERHLEKNSLKTSFEP